MFGTLAFAALCVSAPPFGSTQAGTPVGVPITMPIRAPYYGPNNYPYRIAGPLPYYTSYGPYNPPNIPAYFYPRQGYYGNSNYGQMTQPTLTLGPPLADPRNSWPPFGNPP